MAQVNICHFDEIYSGDSHAFALAVRDIVAWEVHGLSKDQIVASSVSVMVIPIDQQASRSGAVTELQVLVSGNNWPINTAGQPASQAEAKTHFDAMAQRIYDALMQQQNRKLYVWVTPFAASGWAEGEYN